jgi:hypothetical protein
MIAKTTSSARPVSPPFDEDTHEPPWRTAADTMEERLLRIEALGQRINRYVQFIGSAPRLTGTSSEAKEKAVAAFYERMVVLERQLSRIHEELKCG